MSFGWECFCDSEGTKDCKCAPVNERAAAIAEHNAAARAVYDKAPARKVERARSLGKEIGDALRAALRS